MEEIEKLIEKYNKPLTKEQVKAVIYNVFCMAIFLMPILPEVIGVGLYSLRNTIFNFVVIATSIVLICINIKDKKTKPLLYEILLYIYLIIVVISGLNSKFGFWNCFLGTTGRGEGILTIASYVATFLIVFKGYSYIHKNCVYVAVISAVIVSIYGIIQANVPLNVKLPFGSSDVLGVAEGTMKNQNFFASYVCLFLPMMCYYYIDNPKHKGLLSCLFLFTGLVFSKTLTGYITFFAMYVLICIFELVSNNNKKKVILKIGITIALFFAVFSAITFLKGNDYIDELSGVKEEINYISKQDTRFGTGRLKIWKRVLMAINNNKLLGVGPDSLSYEFKDSKYHIFGKEDALKAQNVDKAHCEYLQIAVTTGIPSLIIYSILIFVICIRLLKIVFNLNKKQKVVSIENSNYQYITMIFISIISYLIQAAANISVVQVAPVFWVMLGMGAGITISENKKEQISTL